MKSTTLLFIALFSAICFAQEKVNDSLPPVLLSEIIVIGKKAALHQKQAKSLTTVEDYLMQSPKINMIKRGGYAWEPLLNSMATERTVITIDGMRIFAACTDKMDPVTSYVEVSNLSEATILSGQQGSCHGPTIGGSIDLKQANVREREPGWNGSLTSGYETNNQHKIIGAAVGYTGKFVYANANFMHRDAENYKAGKGEKIAFSQFTKYNISSTLGILLSKTHLLEGTIIYDKATDVGYPSLPMDVSLAQATITSLRHTHKPVSGPITLWETKVYFNAITHKMDDTKRPNVPVHMDMPGWSDTYGLYSKLQAKYKKHSFLANSNMYYNRSIAEMTMYPNDPGQKLMFMYTWPDVRTFYRGLFLEDIITITPDTDLQITANIGWHSNKVADEFGLQSLRIFYPEMQATKNRIVKSLAANYTRHTGKFEYGWGTAYGERVPTVSEGYGFYLYNSNDFYDYIGNPSLKNEKSWEANLLLGFKSKAFTSRITSSFFYLKDYIIGKINPTILPMTIGASGIKNYDALDYALLFNADLDIDYKPAENWLIKAQVTYSNAKDNHSNTLPFISPLRYSGKVQFKKQRLSLAITTAGNLAHRQFAAAYGETSLPGYIIFNLNSGYLFYWKENKLNIQAGVENLLDKKYTTYSDWNKIPRIGRNYFINISYIIF